MLLYDIVRKTFPPNDKTVVVFTNFTIFMHIYEKIFFIKTEKGKKKETGLTIFFSIYELYMN